VISMADVLEQIASLEAQQRGAQEIWQRCEGGLQVCRHWQAKLERLAREQAERAEAELPPANGHGP
jgi:hypothetical protein